MKAVLVAFVAFVGLTMLDAGTAEAFGGRRRGRVTYAPAPAPMAPQYQAGTGYRSYSYEPSAGYQTYSYQPSYSYQPGGTYSRPSRAPVGGFRDAGAKIRGEY